MEYKSSSLGTSRSVGIEHARRESATLLTHVTEEGDASEKRTPGVDKLGQIVIRAQHAKFNGQGPPKTRRPPVTHSQTINEKTIKGQAISHQVK